MPAIEAIEHLAGMQSQAPQAPYVGLWTRLREFGTRELSDLIATRRAVRAPLMRATLLLVSAEDCLAFRPAVQPVLERSFASAPFDVAGVDIAALLDAGRELIEHRPRTRAELGALLAKRWPGHDPASLAQAITCLVPAVQVPPRGIWGKSGQARWTTVESWLGRDLDVDTAAERLVVRYLGAFGPATVRDVQVWSGFTRIAEVIEVLRDQLVTFRAEDGGELFDLPDAPRPDPATPAPPRFLPEYDNLLLSHANRTRFMTGGERVPLQPGLGGRYGMLLIDGVFRGTWRITRQHDTAVLHVEPFTPVSTRDAIVSERAAIVSERAAIVSEGEKLLRFAVEDATAHEVRFDA
jgi:hypothetical protein